MKMNGITLIILVIILIHAVSKTEKNTECETQTITVEGKPTWINFTLPINPVKNPSFVYVLKRRLNSTEFVRVLDGIYNRTKKDLDFYPGKGYVFGILEDKTLVLFIPKASLIHAGVYKVETNTGDAFNSSMGSCRLSVIPAGAIQDPDSARDTVGKVVPVAVESNTSCEGNLHYALISIAVLSVSLLSVLLFLGVGIFISWWKGLAGKPKSKDEEGGSIKGDPSNQERSSPASGQPAGVSLRNRGKGGCPHRSVKFSKLESRSDADADVIVSIAGNHFEREPRNTDSDNTEQPGATLEMASDSEADTITMHGLPVNEYSR